MTRPFSASNHMRVGPVLSCLLAAACAAPRIAPAILPGSPGHRTRNVVLIVTDGMRWQEIFRGADSALMHRAHGGVDDTTALRRQFWRETTAERRTALMPFLWNFIAQRGLIYGDVDSGSVATVTNGLKFSYPGYNEMLTGHADPRINSNSAGPNPNVTVFEWLSHRPGLQGSEAAFGTWSEFDDIFNRERSGLHVRAGWDQPFDGTLTPREALINKLYATSTQFWSDLAWDSFGHVSAMDYLQRHAPHVLFVGYGETDEWAHMGRYDHYLAAAHQVDAFIADLWNTMQSMPEYRGSTTFIITTDHGRGGGLDSWRDHGQDVEGAEDIWIAVLGPDSPALGERTRTATVTQSQIAATLAALLGEDYHAAEPQSASPLPDVIRVR